MSAGHTPGPWRLNAGDSIKVMNPRGLCVAFAACGGMTGVKLDEAEANARLIAAAPDLLAVAETLANWIIELAASGDAGFWDAEAMPEIVAARTAIAKATGQ